jgi:hypothetical protein
MVFNGNAEGGRVVGDGRVCRPVFRAMLTGAALCDPVKPCYADRRLAKLTGNTLLR